MSDAFASATLSSAVYEGRVRHRRHAPRPHDFGYRMAQLYLDLDEIDRVFDGHALWSNDRRNLAEFRRSDYLGDPAMPLAEAVRERAASVTAIARKARCGCSRICATSATCSTR